MEHILGNIFIRPNPMPTTGYVVGDHEHNFDHTSIVIRGSVRVVARDRQRAILWSKNFYAGEYVLIKAEVSHEITALEDDTLFLCVYAHRNAQGDVTQEYSGFDDSYR